MDFFNELIFKKRLGGLTNINLLVTHNNEDFVLRFPSLEFEGIIDRKNEKINNQIAIINDVAVPNILFTDEGVKVTAHYSATENLKRNDFKSDSYLQRVGELLKKLHSISEPFKKTFDYWLEVESYKESLNEIPELYYRIEEKLRIISNQESNCYVPCHIDPLPENFVQDEEGKLFLIDWEYSGNYLGEWDLASFILENELNNQEERKLIEFYNDPSISIESLNLQKVKQDFLWSLWGLIKQKEDSSFKVYTEIRTNRLIKNIAGLNK